MFVKKSFGLCEDFLKKFFLKLKKCAHTAKAVGASREILQNYIVDCRLILSLIS